MSEEKTIVVDFDGVLADYSKGWNDGKIGKPITGSKEALTRLRGQGFKIVIQTTRLHPKWGRKSFEQRYLDLLVWLKQNDIPYDEVEVFGKAYGLYYIDDRAIRFRNWGEVEERIKRLEGKEVSGEKI